MNTETFRKVLEILRREYGRWDAPAKRFENAYERTPYTILNSTLLSFRTKDEVTLAAGQRLFALATTPQEMVKLDRETVAEAIYPVGFYNKKAQSILDVARDLLEHHGGEVPDTFEALVRVKGIGPKTANIVLENAFGQKTVAVDTHVHRIVNLLGFVDTAAPEATERALKETLDATELAGLNKLLVSFGQVICRPQKPHCGECPVRQFCPTAS